MNKYEYRLLGIVDGKAALVQAACASDFADDKACTDETPPWAAER